MSMPRSNRNRSLAPVRDPDASPFIPYLLIVDHGIVDLDPKSQYLGREAPHGSEQGIRRHDAIPLRCDQGMTPRDLGMCRTARRRGTSG